ncbi:MAG: FecR family protein, partial [Lacipirellulaceae bacterium]
MKHPYSEDDWADLLQRIVDDEVSSVDLKRLEAILLDDGAKQGEFVDYLLMHDLLDEWLGPEGLIGAVDMLSSDETLPHSPSVVSAGALALETKAERRFSANLVWGLAIALLVAMGTWAYWPIRHQPNRFAKASSDEKHTQNEAIAVARLASGYQVQFSQDKQPEGDSFRAGEYRLERGAAGVIFDNGTKLVVESPAEFTIVNSMSVVLHQGKVRAHVPDAAKGFTISTPDFEVEDLGTEFGVSVLDDKTADVRVFSGKVRLLQEGELLKELAVGSGDSWLQRNGPEIANIRGTSYLTSADLGRRRWNEFKAELLTDP